MTRFNQPIAMLFQSPLLRAVVGGCLAAACLDASPTGLNDGSGGAPGQSTAGTSASQGGKANTGGTGAGEGGTDASSGAVASAGTSPGAGDGPGPGEGGAPSVGAEGGAGGSGGDSGDGVHIGPSCTFHTDAPAPTPGAAGAGGESSEPDLVSQLSPFVGSYLTDAAGRTLYTYGADLPGDCEHAPVSGCVADCLVSWPVFDAGDRVLGPGLSDAGFGVIERPEGGYQTTYMGWPLYYYKSDLALGQLTGQGKGKLWHVAEVNMPAVVIMKSGMLKYLADANGRTLYVSAADQAGTAEADPVSNCDGACRDTFEAFHEKKLSVVTSLESSDFQVFARHGTGGLQLAYKGLPLYRAATDVKSGDMTGTATSGFTAALP